MLKQIKKVIKEPKRAVFGADQRGYLNLLPDKTYLKIMYKANVGQKLNLTKPITFNEKLQWLKIYNRQPEYTQMVDKYEVKQYVAEKIGLEYIIPTYGVWDSFNEIDFNVLPNQFVLKCTHDSGGLVICRDKSVFDIDAARKKINKSLKRNYFYNGREWPYKDLKPRIIAEKYMEDSSGDQLMDYKFYCFNGKPEFLYLSHGLENHSTASISFLTLNWKRAPFERSDYLPFKEIPPKPSNFKEMKLLAEKLSKGLPFLRVDLYEINGQLYFSELTFFPCSGHLPFKPMKYDREIGKLLKLPNETNI
ncbi:glycosyl transferase [Priestia aryabhattai]|uniref:ATP-grasp fold amidoligase family protein n=1 Tax=Priestia aryabhattai TaxID=412384 RepID=UPI00211CA981|nr:ATP-grasp fold amidoligase family protein [Priestia aryabhattai]MCQ9281070.1 glycosyl transferase [Priestia aryabhattai]